MNNFEKAKNIIEEYRKLRLFPEKKNAFIYHIILNVWNIIKECYHPLNKLSYYYFYYLE